MKHAVRVGIVATLLTGAGWSHAITTMTVEQLRAICAEDDNDPRQLDACGLYLRGFLDGAIATDERVVENVVRELEGASFGERAYRTRLGPRLEHYGPASFADLCIGQTVSLQQLREAVTTALGKPVTATDSAREFVYEQLHERFPCIAEAQN